ncbi:hypothetical protein BCR37DRAFT_218174 [Protomyces lactucae-debilis]|uniref:Uncharacterized protein n=1 Tax=Protomyces lactucae-debilis TaxID=2754530 RepID=A0A1Y2FQW9_PROLT|nr:uncharacterized protein BCR37DRAFT_218174 [Protomyces lactucae-debilis]ORY86329.1 hypothetical protein BCR37DRAFT_218174 [Protomyces lactucae-debilis]
MLVCLVPATVAARQVASLLLASDATSRSSFSGPPSQRSSTRDECVLGFAMTFFKLGFRSCQRLIFIVGKLTVFLFLVPLEELREFRDLAPDFSKAAANGRRLTGPKRARTVHRPVQFSFSSPSDQKGVVNIPGFLVVAIVTAETRVLPLFRNFVVGLA